MSTLAFAIIIAKAPLTSAMFLYMKRVYFDARVGCMTRNIAGVWRHLPLVVNVVSVLMGIVLSYLYVKPLHYQLDENRKSKTGEATKRKFLRVTVYNAVGVFVCLVYLYYNCDPTS